MMNMITMMRDIHENAKAHGWWDDKRTERGCRALIVSEWAEALEEARSGRPMVWYGCRDASKGTMCHEGNGCRYREQGHADVCPMRDGKPEGIAVELMDGCIRILDWLGHIEYSGERLPVDMQQLIRMGRAGIEVQCIKNEEIEGEYYTADTMPVDVLVDALNQVTMHSAGGYGTFAYVQAMSIACAWVAAHGEDPEKLMLEKHEYNKTRPYKHGKKF